MLTLIRNARLFSPDDIGRRDVLLAGNKIAAVEKKINLTGEPLREIDAQDQVLVPGFIDVLTHPCGGGGEGGFHNRTRELTAAEFISAGVTSPVGALGTDSITRSLDVLYGSTMQLRTAGLDAYMYTGSYRVPAPTLTGDVARDLTHIAPVLGLGEIAISDHRSSQPSIAELRRLAADIHLGGTLSGKAGVMFLHVGAGEARLDLLEELLDASDLPAQMFYTTHINRSSTLLEHGVVLAKRGCFIDITVSTTPEFIEQGELAALDALRYANDKGVGEQVSISSDAGGSLPVYKDKKLVGSSSARPRVLLDLVHSVLQTRDAAMVLTALSRTPARALGLRGKGQIAPGFDADLLLLNPSNRLPQHVFCLGQELAIAPQHSLSGR